MCRVATWHLEKEAGNCKDDRAYGETRRTFSQSICCDVCRMGQTQTVGSRWRTWRPYPPSTTAIKMPPTVSSSSPKHRPDNYSKVGGTAHPLRLSLPTNKLIGRRLLLPNGFDSSGRLLALRRVATSDGHASIRPNAKRALPYLKAVFSWQSSTWASQQGSKMPKLADAGKCPGLLYLSVRGSITFVGGHSSHMFAFRKRTDQNQSQAASHELKPNKVHHI